MFSIVLDTPYFVEHQYSTRNLEKAQIQMDLLEQDLDESVFTLYLVEYDEDEVDYIVDWYDTFEEENSPVKLIEKRTRGME